MCGTMMRQVGTPIARAASTNSLDAHRQRLAAHDARHVHPRERRDGDHHQVELAAEQRHHQDRDQQVGNGVHHVDDAHHRRCRRARRRSRRSRPRRCRSSPTPAWPARPPSARCGRRSGSAPAGRGPIRRCPTSACSRSVGGSFIAFQSAESKSFGSSIGPTTQASAISDQHDQADDGRLLRMKRRRASLHGLRPRVATGASASGRRRRRGWCAGPCQ